MAKLNIQGKSIEMKTKSRNWSNYYAIVNFNTPESEKTEYCKSLKIPLEGESRREITFDKVESKINEYFKENYSELEISEFLSIEIEERTTIKKRPYDNYDY